MAQAAGVSVFTAPSHTLHDPEAYMAKLKGGMPPIAYQVGGVGGQWGWGRGGGGGLMDGLGCVSRSVCLGGVGMGWTEAVGGVDCSALTASSHCLRTCVWCG